MAAATPQKQVVPRGDESPASSPVLVRYVAKHDLSMLLNNMVLALVASRPGTELGIYSCLIEHLEAIEKERKKSAADAHKSTKTAAPIPRDPLPKVALTLPKPLLLVLNAAQAATRIQSLARRRAAVRRVEAIRAQRNGTALPERVARSVPAAKPTPATQPAPAAATEPTPATAASTGAATEPTPSDSASTGSGN
jgi:hypothetical protein